MSNQRPHFRLLAATSLLIALPADGGELRYAPALHEAAWHVGVSREECRLVQEIPRYGRAVFSRKAGRDLEFALSVKQSAPRETEARLQSLPPAWIHTAAAVDFGAVRAARGDTPFLFTGDQARRLLAELEKGMQPTVVYRDWGDARDNVVVSVSAVNLRKSLPPFLDCLSGLLPYDFGDMRSSVIQFGLASSTLDPQDRQRLARVAEYVLADDSVTGLRLEGYTDNLGFRTANQRLSMRRAEAVRQFLVQQGVPAARIHVEYRGEAEAVANNRSEEGRARNRRVEVTLLR